MALAKEGELAQLGERLVCNQEVTGSIPVFSTILVLTGGAFGAEVGFGWQASKFNKLLTRACPP